MCATDVVQLILIVANELTLVFALNLIYNLKEHGMDHYLLITTADSLCQRLKRTSYLVRNQLILINTFLLQG